MSAQPTPPAPIRFQVSYKTPKNLISEFTRSVGKGGVAIESRKALSVGTRFVFELRAAGVIEAVEVTGEVVRVTPTGAGKFVIHIRYDAAGDRRGLDALIQRVFDSQANEVSRKYPRIPTNLGATEGKAGTPSYRVADISRGGLGVEVLAQEVPRAVRVGTPFLLELSISIGMLALHGEVAWVFTPPPDASTWISPSFGVQFGKLRADTEERLSKIMTLKGLPPPPWTARVSFGMDAVSRMP